MTGSFFAAALDGTIPAIEVSTILNTIIKSACSGLSIHMPDIDARLLMIMLIGILNK